MGRGVSGSDTLSTLMRLADAAAAEVLDADDASSLRKLNYSIRPPRCADRSDSSRPVGCDHARSRVRQGDLGDGAAIEDLDAERVRAARPPARCDRACLPTVGRQVVPHGDVRRAPNDQLQMSRVEFRPSAAALLRGECRHLILAPGFVSAHSHIYTGGMCGVAASSPLYEWVSRNSRMLLGAEADDLYWMSLAGALDHLSCGITAVYNFTQ